MHMQVLVYQSGSNVHLTANVEKTKNVVVANVFACHLFSLTTEMETGVEVHAINSDVVLMRSVLQQILHNVCVKLGTLETH